MDTQPNRSIHIPYVIDEASERSAYYENHWKRQALALLAADAGNLQGMSLLDYGCGRGETLEYAANYGMQVEGLDIDPECVRIASAKGAASLLDLNNLTQQLGEKTYDVVTCFHVLEHVDNPKQILSLLARAARKYVVVAVPNLRQINNLRRPRREAARVNEGHLQSWDHPHFRNLAENHCGLRILSWGFDATYLPVVSELVKRMLGNKVLIKLETGLFRKLFPYNGISVIALMQPVA
jgi:cyclopropane fatty-acyl-phospholipid synthase-like methyltransferase